MESELVLAGGDHDVGLDRVPLLADEVVHEAEPAVEQVERPAAEHRAHREQHPFGGRRTVGELDVGA